MVECPSRSCAILGLTPCESMSVAQVPEIVEANGAEARLGKEWLKASLVYVRSIHGRTDLRGGYKILISV